MKKIVFAFMLLANVAIAQPSVFHGVSLSIAHLNEDVKGEYIWSDMREIDFPVIMHKDTLIMKSPYQTKRFVNSKYRRIDSETEEWQSTDEDGEKCWVYLMDYDDATYVRVEYADRAYYVEIQLYD
jgi:hypothetical protein